MGKIKQGILGGVSGQIGNVIGGNWKGTDYLRIKPSSVANPKTTGQMDQRSKFSTVLKFLQPITGFLKVGFKLYAIEMTEFNCAMSYNLLNAVTGTYPNYEIDYANALVWRGHLSRALDPTATSTVAGSVEVTWEDNSGSSGAQATDKSLIVLLNPSKKDAVFLVDGATRTAGTETLTVPVDYSGDTLEAFISFISQTA